MLLRGVGTICPPGKHHSENFRTSPKIEKCKQIFEMFGFCTLLTGGLLTGGGGYAACRTQQFPARFLITQEFSGAALVHHAATCSLLVPASNIYLYIHVYMAVFVYLSPEISCFFGPVPVVTKLPKLALRGHGIPPAGVGQHKEHHCFQ
jgi:cytochrome b subunit of formate dehydrogenase